MKTMLLALAVVCSITITSAAEKTTRTYAANSPEIRYVGRTVVSPKGDVSFDWSGTYLTTRFKGKQLAVRVSDTKKNYYNIFIDGKQTGVITTFGTDSLVVLAQDLPNTIHTITLQKRTEGEQGRTTIHGFELAQNGTLLAPETTPKRHIEFIGNSLTCGYGTEGPSKTDPFKAETENCNLAYACIISRYFDADYTLIAHSGQGATRNWGDQNRSSRYTMKDRMMRTFDLDTCVMWDFKTSPYKPDMVVINLGSNDFSTKPQPTYELFATAYLRIIMQVREAYGDVPILCIAPLVEEPAQTYIKAFCDSCTIPGVHFTALHEDVHNRESDLGSSYHPNYNGQKKKSMALIPYISTITNWELNSKVVE